jgi:protoheme IX farnesyltransferase
MAESAFPGRRRRLSVLASWRDYRELTKPGVVALMILTSVIGMCMAVPGWVPLDALMLGNLGIALCAGAAAAVNHVVDQQHRPAHGAHPQPARWPRGRVSNRNAIAVCRPLSAS